MLASSAILSAQQLAEHLLQALPAASRITILAAQQPAFPLAQVLGKRFAVAELVLYRTRNHVAWPSGEAISEEQKKKLGKHPTRYLFRLARDGGRFLSHLSNRTCRVGRKFSRRRNRGNDSRRDCEVFPAQQHQLCTIIGNTGT